MTHRTTMPMRNFDNSLRFYNRQVLKRTKMHTYTKKYIDNLMSKSMYDTCKVVLKKLTAEDIENFKLSFIKNQDNLPKEECIDDTSIDNEPAEKKQKLDTNGIDILKMELSKERETHKFKSQINSSLKTIKEIVSTSTEEVPTVTDCDESTKCENFSATNVKPKIMVIDPRKMMNEDSYIKWMKFVFLDKKPKHVTNGKTNLEVAIPSTSNSNPPLYSSKVKGVKYPLNAKNHARENLTEIERLYNKYFGKSVKDTIMIIANILNIISISNKHHKERMDESFKKKSEVEKFNERCNASRLHGTHKTILETKLKTNFVNVISSFAESEFDIAFQMFFLSTLTVLRVLDQTKYKKGSIFKILALLLLTSLKNSGFKHPKIFSTFKSKQFRPDCIELISLIEDSRDTDPGIIFRMPCFFMSTVDSKRYFNAAIDAVTGKSNEDLALLIDNASFHYSIKDQVDSSNKRSNRKLPLTETIQSPINSDNIIQHTFLDKNENGTCQVLPVLNGNKSQTIGNAGVEPSIVTSQPLNNFYKSISSTQQKKTSAYFTSTVIPTKKCTVVTPTISSSPLNLHQTVTSTSTKKSFGTLNPSVQNIKTEPNSSSYITESSTILHGNKLYKIVNTTSGKMKAGAIDNNLHEKPPSTALVKCFVINCKKSAKMMCGKCLTVKYCSINCQRRHWYTNHLNECDDLLSKSKNPP